MPSGNDPRPRHAERRASRVLDCLTDIPVQTERANLVVVNAQRVGHGLFLGFRMVKKVHVVLYSVRRGFLGPAAQLVHPPSFYQNPLAQLIPSESASATTSFIVLTVTMVVMLSAALGLSDGIAELRVSLSFPGAVARVGRSAAWRRAIVSGYVDGAMRATPRVPADVYNDPGLIVAAPPQAGGLFSCLDRGS